MGARTDAFDLATQKPDISIGLGVLIMLFAVIMFYFAHNPQERVIPEAKPSIPAPAHAQPVAAPVETQARAEDKIINPPTTDFQKKPETSPLARYVQAREADGLSYEQIIIDDLAYTMWCEAAGDGKQGMLAVGDVVKNRVNSKLFPNDWLKVIHAPKQFSCWGADGFTRIKTDMDIHYYQAKRLAKRIYYNKAPKMTANALFYHTTEIKPYWRKSYEKLGTIGNHVFYTASRL